MRYIDEYIGLIKENRDEYFRDYLDFNDRVLNSRAKYKGQGIPVTYQGFFFNGEDMGNFKKWTRTINDIGKKVLLEYLENEEYRKLFGFSRDLEELILHYPQYDMPVVVGRYDIFFNGGEDFKFCELNTDGSSAMNEEEEVSKNFLKTKAISDLSKKEGLSFSKFDLFYSLIDRFSQLYFDIRGEKLKNIAIVDFIDKGSNEEFIVFKEKFIERGFSCEICDPRDLRYVDGKLKHGDFEIDLVYRRAVTKDLMERKEEIGDFLRAYLKDAFLMFGSFRSQLMHSKLIFKILRLDETKRLLNSYENKFIEDHIPFTEELISDDDYSEVISNKDKYILKPYDGYASSGIITGRDFSREDFSKIVNNIERKTYIYQEYVDVKKRPFVVFDGEGNLKVLDFSHVLGLFIYGEEFSGMYSRIGRENIVSGRVKYFVSPSIKVSRRKD